ncbi:MAG TPA: hypothetical protein VH083_25360, partial [Myxococcales bacterium]|nr:hypothetical protein [Myxococcales bacterium]
GRDTQVTIAIWSFAALFAFCWSGAGLAWAVAALFAGARKRPRVLLPVLIGGPLFAVTGLFLCSLGRVYSANQAHGFSAGLHGLFIYFVAQIVGLSHG